MTDVDHVPVLADEVVRLFCGQMGSVVDCTLGLGGHSTILLSNTKSLSIIGLDRDSANLEYARHRLEPFGNRFRGVRADFGDLKDALQSLGITTVSGVLADLGLSSNQIADPTRGFSFEIDGPLDMRMDQSAGPTAADLINTLSEGELSDLLYFQSQERHSRKIAKRICQARRQGRINSTVMLARLIASAVGENPESRAGRIHPATRTFMALRMAVNHELASLQRLLAAAPSVLVPGGRIAVISFHSGEDRLVKEDFKARAAAGVYKVLTKKPLTASDNEVQRNPRSRSAKLRAAEMPTSS